MHAQMPQTGIKGPPAPKFQPPPAFQRQGVNMLKPTTAHPQPQRKAIPPPQSVTLHQPALNRNQAALAEIRAHDHAISYQLPSKQQNPAAVWFQKAYQLLSGALDANQSISTQQAVFWVENAFQSGTLRYADFDAQIRARLRICQSVLTNEGGNPGSASAKHEVLQRMFRDTLWVEGKRILPFRYDFNDPWGFEDYRKQFVTKTLASGTGQCHSLPLLYKILADAWGISSQLVFSPGHCYIQFQGDAGKWQPFETTNGHPGARSWILASGKISSEALRSGIYLTPLNDQETVAFCLSDLALGYSVRCGMDAFVGQCVSASLKHCPHNLQALLIQSNYHTETTRHILNQVGETSEYTLRSRYPRAWQQMQRTDKIYDELDNKGFIPMSQIEYQTWLKSHPNN